jgi:hypothetical protein
MPIGVDFIDAIFDRRHDIAGCGQVELERLVARGDNDLVRFPPCIDRLAG